MGRTRATNSEASQIEEPIDSTEGAGVVEEQGTDQGSNTGDTNTDDTNTAPESTGAGDEPDAGSTEGDSAEPGADAGNISIGDTVNSGPAE